MHDEIVKEINSVLDELAERKETWVASWIAQHICNNHESGLSSKSIEDAEFWRHGGYNYVRSAVTKVINRRAGDQPAKDGKQFRLEGFNHVQEYYVVSRDGSDIGVSVYQMTDQEIMEKVSLHRAFAIANAEHADELERFLDLRRATA